MTIENIGAQTAPLLDWCDALFAWPHLEMFKKKHLQLTEYEASSVNCKTECAMPCPRKVVVHSKRNVVAICKEQKESKYALKYKDILTYKLNTSSLALELCSVLGIHHEEHALSDFRFTWQLGHYKPREGHEFPVYLIFPESQDHLMESLKHICLLQEHPFAIITPTKQYHFEATKKLLSARTAVALTLDSCVDFDSSGKLAATSSPESLFSEFHKNIPSKLEQFPTPPNTEWSSVVIEFVDNHTVSIRIGDLHRRYGYDQMNMRNNKSNAPDRHWRLLQKFANQDGVIGFIPTRAIDTDANMNKLGRCLNAEAGGFQIKRSLDKTMKKHKQGLSKLLRNFFGIKDEPIVWDSNELCYRCLFAIYSDN